LTTGYQIDSALVARYAREETPPAPIAFPLSDPHAHDPGLSLAEYDALEAAGAAHLPPPLLTAFRPSTFEQFGFPTRIRETREILRYADWNWEQYGPRLFARGAVYPEVCFINAFTRDEWAMIDGLGRSVAQMTQRRGGRPVRPVTVLMNAITPLRIMSRLAEGASRSISVFEVGPGMAYLGPMLAALGHRYRCFDVTQAFCLWQHHMLRWTVGSGFAELAQAPLDAPIPDAAVVNVPWWRYVGFLFGDSIEPVDVVYSNSNLCEMMPDARRCVLQLSHRMLSQSPLGVFCYIGPGAPAQCNASQLQDEIAKAGFQRVAGAPFAAWTAHKNPAHIAALFNKGIPHFNPSRRDEIFPADVVMRIPRAQAPLDVPYAKWLWGWEPPYLD